MSRALAEVHTWLLHRAEKGQQGARRIRGWELYCVSWPGRHWRVWVRIPVSRVLMGQSPLFK